MTLNESNSGFERPAKVVIVDDSLVMRRWLTAVMERDARLDVVGLAATAEEARAVIKATAPDVLTLDLDMPGMNGLQFLSHLMRLRPMPVVILSGQIAQDRSLVQKSIDLGAAACVPKPALPTPDALCGLCDQIVAAARGVATSDLGTAPRPALPGQIILVGASTGGVAAIETLLDTLPDQSPPVVIAQHMPQGFLESFVQRLDSRGSHSVLTAEPDTDLTTGDVRLAPATDHQTGVVCVGNTWRTRCLPVGPDDRFVPSVDALFFSAVPWADHVGSIMLTGIGDDGARGMRALRENGARTVGQSQDSCVVYGMPGAARGAGAVEMEVDVRVIAPTLLRMMQGSA